MPMSEKFITYMESAAGTLPKSEAEIGELISASIENGILSCSGAADDAYFSFVFLNTQENEPSYEVCFGKNPNRTTHPTAERALRASEFVTRLLNVINTGHSCHIVAADVIVDPIGELSDAERGKLTRRLFVNGDIRIQSTEAETELDGENDDVVAHELDVMLYASADSEFARISSCVHITESGGKLHFALGEGQSALKQRRAGEESQLSLTEERKREAADILDKINANYEEYTNAILNAIAVGETQARANARGTVPETPFLSFLEEAAKTTNRVGMIRVLPCALFVGAATAKTFRYRLAGGVSFHLSWNEKSSPASADELLSRLYVIKEPNSQKFIGLTYRDTLKGAKLAHLRADERIAFDCYYAEDGKLVRGNAVVNSAHLRSCTCGAAFYADDAYMKAHACIDSTPEKPSHYCDLCKQGEVRKGREGYVVLKEVSHYATGAHGLVYANCQSGGQLPPAGNGNVFACKSCSAPVFLATRADGCETCANGLYYCKKCRDKLTKSIPVFNAVKKTRTATCPSCPKPNASGEVMTDGTGALYTCRAQLDSKKPAEEIMLWDNVESKTLYHCSRCRKLWYSGDDEKCIRECSSCGKAYCPDCFKKSKQMCPDCEALAGQFKEFLASQMDRILPLLNLSDVKRLKESPLSFTAHLYTYENLERGKAFSCKRAYFRLTVSHRSYFLTLAKVGTKYTFRLEAIA